MQTFMPYKEFKASAECLDMKRLGKQRIEAFQILQVLTGNGKGWASHPAVGMWRGCMWGLGEYGRQCCLAWKARGYKDTMLPRFDAIMATLEDRNLPAWLGDEAFHRSHQSNLIRKKPEWYGEKFPGVPNDLSYVWPKGASCV